MSKVVFVQREALCIAGLILETAEVHTHKLLESCRSEGQEVTGRVARRRQSSSVNTFLLLFLTKLTSLPIISAVIFFPSKLSFLLLLL